MKEGSRGDKALWIGMCMVAVGLLTLAPMVLVVGMDVEESPLFLAAAGLFFAGIVTVVATVMTEMFLRTWGYRD